MLPAYKMVKVKEAKELLYTGVLSIIEWVKVLRDNKSTGYEEVVTHKGVKCRLSVKTLSSTSPSDTAHGTSQVIKVFLSPDVEVKPGSRLIITQNGVTCEYKHSGIPARYTTHQEIILERAEEYS